MVGGGYRSTLGDDYHYTGESRCFMNILSLMRGSNGIRTRATTVTGWRANHCTMKPKDSWGILPPLANSVHSVQPQHSRF